MVGRLEKPDEKVFGEIPVTVKLPMGFERLTLYFTDRRILVGHLSKVGAGSVTPTFLFGSIGSTLGSLFGRRKKVRAEAKSQYPSPGRVLGSHPDNFSILFDEVISVDLAHESKGNSISILSRNEKLDFSCRSRFDVVRTLFEKALGEKVRVH